MKTNAIIALYILAAAFAGCRQRPRIDLKQHADMAPVARELVLKTFTNIDASLLEHKGGGGMFGDDGTLERYSAEFRLPVDTNGIFVFFEIEMDTTQDPPVVTYLTKGTGQLERVLSEQVFSPEQRD